MKYPIYPWMLQVQPEDLKDSFLAYWHDRWSGSPPSISHENGHGTIPTTRQTHQPNSRVYAQYEDSLLRGSGYLGSG